MKVDGREFAELGVETLRSSGTRAIHLDLPQVRVPAILMRRQYGDLNEVRAQHFFLAVVLGVGRQRNGDPAFRLFDVDELNLLCTYVLCDARDTKHTNSLLHFGTPLIRDQLGHRQKKDTSAHAPFCYVLCTWNWTPARMYIICITQRIPVCHESPCRSEWKSWRACSSRPACSPCTGQSP